MIGIIGRLFMPLRGFLTSKGGSSMIGLIAIMALVWYAGPYIGLSDVRTRLYIIGGLLGLALLIIVVRLLLVRRRGGKLKKELDGQNDERAAQRDIEIGAIREKMNEAIGSLKSSQLGAGYRGSAALYALPWYMVIGPSAAGKSTLLRQSGLHFPYANADDLHLRGFGGTRNCDWWFSDQAILLDTAGRYTTEEDDREEWFAFLNLLRKHRPKMPVNGVIVAISVSDLLTADAEGLERHVKIIRERINELIKQLGLLFPVYVVFTKCDLVRGFEAYFEDLSEQERNQVWGTYLLENPQEDEHPADLFERKMRELYAKLSELRLRKMSMQRNLERKASLFDFPNQFVAATERLTEFVHLLFRDNPYQETPRFAGIYFTSGTQEGTPLQRLVGNLRQAFGYSEDDTAERTAPPKAYFIKSLFTDVIFQLQSAVRGNRRRIVLHRWLKGTAVAASLAVMVGTFLLLSGSYAANKLLVSEGAAVAGHLQETLLDVKAQPLQRYKALTDVYHYYNRLLENERALPWQFKLGVYTGDQQIPEYKQLLTDALQRQFRDRVFKALEFHLENLGRQWEAADKEGRERLRENYYRALKAYLMVAKVPGRLDLDVATPVLIQLWAESLGVAKLGTPYKDVLKSVPDMDGMARFYLNGSVAGASAAPHWPVRNDLIAKARSQLRTPPNAEQLYAQLKNKGKVKFHSVGVADLLTGQNRGLLDGGKRIPGIYTRRGWAEFVRPELKKVIETATRGDWVLNGDLGAGKNADAPVKDEPVIDEELAEKLRGQVREKYFQDYADHWLDFLAAVQPKPFESLQDASVKLMTLARSDGPIGELMSVTAKNINLTDDGSAAELTPAQLEAATADGRRAGVRVPELDMPLSDLRRFTNAAEKKTVSELVNQYLLVLSSLKNEMERLSASVDVQREAQTYAASILSSGGSSTELYKSWVSTNSLLNGTDVRTREAIEPLLIRPIRYSWAQVLVEARKQIQREWQYNVVNAYNQRLADKFPFNPKGKDAALDDVTEFFRPDDGVLWHFVDHTLDPFLAERRHGWRERRWLNLGVGFSRSFLRSLAEAKSITVSLFKRGGDEPQLTFYVYPMPVRGLSEMVLETNGQVYRYRNEPQEWRRFSWPGQLDQIGARVAGVAMRGTAHAELRAGGQWGLFHLLKDARLTKEGGTEFLTEWDLDTDPGEPPIKVRFRIRADRQNSIFQQKVMSGFGVPGALFARHGRLDFARMAKAD